MKCVKTPHFLKQIEKIEKKYRRIQSDIDDFCREATLDTSSVELWNNFYKIRVRNSSIPTGKRWGFRIIAKLHQDTLYPFLVYSKTEKENATLEEIEENYEKMIQELGKQILVERFGE